MRDFDFIGSEKVQRWRVSIIDKIFVYFGVILPDPVSVRLVNTSKEHVILLFIEGNVFVDEENVIEETSLKRVMGVFIVEQLKVLI